MPSPCAELSFARTNGLDRYFTGTPCKKGHVAERWVTGRMCVECRAERLAADKTMRRKTGLRGHERRDALASGVNTYFTGRPCVHGHLADRRVSDHICVECYSERIKEQSIARKTRFKDGVYIPHHEDTIQHSAIMPARPGIYCIIHKESLKVYIGSAINLAQRIAKHVIQLKKRTHDNIRLQRSWDKYGASAFKFVVVEYINNINMLIEREQKWIDVLDACGDSGYNIAPKAGSTLGSKRSAEQKASMRKASAGRNKGRIMDAATKQKIRLANAGKPKSAEHRARLSTKAKARYSKFSRNPSQGVLI